MAMMDDENWRLDMRKTIEGFIVRLDEMMAQWRKNDTNRVVKETEAVDEAKVEKETENEIEAEDEAEAETKTEADIEEAEAKTGVQALMDTKTEVVVVKDQAQPKEPTKFEDGGKWLDQQSDINSNSMELQTIVYHRLEVTTKFLNTDICEKLKRASAMVFVAKIVVVNDPYGFRLLVMGNDEYMKMFKSGFNKLNLVNARYFTGQNDRALIVVKEMIGANVMLNESTLVTVLLACAHSEFLDLVKCNMYIDLAKDKSISSGFEVFLREQGAKGFCMGWTPTMLSYSVHSACKVGFDWYDFLGEHQVFMKFQQPQKSQCIMERRSKLGSKDYSDTMKNWDPYGFMLLVMDRGIASWTAMMGVFTWHSSYEKAMWLFLDVNGKDLVFAEPVNFVPESHGFLLKVENLEMRAWAIEVHALLKEYQFWSLEIQTWIIRDAEQGNHSLTWYYAMWNKPRPKALTVDREFASKFLNVSEKQLFYRELTLATESGWNFRTRWMRNSSEFTTLSTTTILPVDLNIFILRMELNIALLAKVVGENTIAEDFLKASQIRQKAFNSIFWNENMGQWVYYWLNNGTECKEPQTWEAQNQNVFASNFVSLWIDLFNSNTHLVEKVLVQWATLFQKMLQGRAYLICSKDFLILILEDKDL